MATYHKVGAVALALVVAMSPAGLERLKSREALRTTAYADPYYGWSVATICYGRTLNVKQGDTATKQQCEAWLKQDVARHCRLVYDALLGTNIWLTQGEQDAYCDFAYNLGKFKGTDSVYGRLVAHDDYGACMGLLRYYFSNGKPSRGLWERRYEQYNICISQLDVRYKPRVTYKGVP